MLNLFLSNWKILACLVALSASFYAGHRLASGECAKDALNASNAALEAVNKNIAKSVAEAAALQKKLTQLGATNAAQAEKLKKLVKSNPVYNSCKLPDDGVQLLNDAIDHKDVDPK